MVMVRGSFTRKVSERMVLKEGRSLVRGSFAWKCEGKGFRKNGGLFSGLHKHGNTKGKVSERMVVSSPVFIYMEI